MNTEISGVLQIVTDAVSRMQEWPAAVLIVVVLIVAGGGMKSLAVFPNRFIPLSVIVLGFALNVLLGDKDTISPNQRNPLLVLGLQGVLLGFTAWMLHALVVKRFEKFIPFLGDKTEDTDKTPPKQ